jgi:hypothetical protein
MRFRFTLVPRSSERTAARHRHLHPLQVWYRASIPPYMLPAHALILLKPLQLRRVHMLDHVIRLPLLETKAQSLMRVVLLSFAWSLWYLIYMNSESLVAGSSGGDTRPVMVAVLGIRRKVHDCLFLNWMSSSSERITS